MEDATRQGATDQDDIGFDLEPVTAESPEEGGQADSVPTPTPEPEEVPEEKERKEEGAVKPNADAKKERILEKKTKISQEEWQETQDRLAAQSAEIATIRTEKEQAKFEARNPIVTSERYNVKWEELCKAKLDPDHKYHRLDFSDLRKLLIEDDVSAENDEAIEEYETSEKKKPISPPLGGSSTNVQKKAPGGVDPETYDYLKNMGYTDAQIAASGDISLAR